ncbi:hypothetical protein I79_025917 [Cricetulus griseus]|uniref:Uncharacterized protein n=1 Tax=Cricetulus griseus TaxID=10029 RepID=G3IPK3_CRIGR|nr:hypothetical protein I79_025917 [Cricetulus griseus]ERE81046.1 hypothetical protein H671_3g8462 [Cricetulus griseus]
MPAMRQSTSQSQCGIKPCRGHGEEQSSLLCNLPGQAHLETTPVTEEVRAKEDKGSHKHRSTALKSQGKPKQGSSSRPPWPRSAPSEPAQDKPFVFKQEFMKRDYNDPVKDMGTSALEEPCNLDPSVLYSSSSPYPKPAL